MKISRKLFGVIFDILFGFRPNEAEQALYKEPRLSFNIGKNGIHLALVYEARDIIDIQKGQWLFDEWSTVRRAIL